MKIVAVWRTGQRRCKRCNGVHEWMSLDTIGNNYFGWTLTTASSFVVCLHFGLYQLLVLSVHAFVLFVPLLGLLRVLEYSSLSISGCKFPVLVVVFAVSWWIVEIFENLGLRDFICNLPARKYRSGYIHVHVGEYLLHLPHIRRERCL